MAIESNIDAKDTREATHPPADQFAETTKNANTIFAAAANPYISTISTGHSVLLAFAKLEEEKQNTHHFMTALTIQQETNARIEARIRDEQLNDLKDFNSNWNTLSKEERKTKAQKIINDAADKVQKEDPKKSRAQAIKIGTNALVKISEEEGFEQEIIAEIKANEALLLEGITQRNAATHNSIGITARSEAQKLGYNIEATEQQFSVDPGILRAIERKEAQIKEQGNELSSEQKQIMAYGMMAPKQLKASKELLEQMEKAHLKLTEKIENTDLDRLPNNLEMMMYEQQTDLKEAIEDQKNKVAFEEKVVELVKEIDADETGRFKDMSMDDIISYTTTERPDIIQAFYAANDEATIKESLSTIAAEMGMSPEDIQKMGVQMQRMQEASELSTQTLDIIKEAGSRHDFLLDHTIKMATDQEILRDSEGRAVHHNNELGLYYIQKDDNGDINRIKYTDPLEIAQLRAKAWDTENPQNYANEIATASPLAPKLEDHEIDPENGFFETTQRNLSEAEIAKNMVTEDTNNLDNKNVTLAGTMGEGTISAALRAVQTLATSPEALEQIMNDPKNIKEGFTTAATETPEEKSALQNEFADKAPPESKGWFNSFTGTKVGYTPNMNEPAQNNDNVPIKNAM